MWWLLRVRFVRMCTVHHPGWRTDKADREYEGLSAQKGGESNCAQNVQVIIPKHKYVSTFPPKHYSGK